MKVNTTNTNIKHNDNLLKVRGKALAVGDTAPQIQLTGVDLKDITWNNFAGKNVILSVVPSIDTPTCSLQTKRFNQEIEKRKDTHALLTVSVDLPFAMKRFAAAENCGAGTYASDYKYHKFGEAFGVFLEETALLARAVFLINNERKITYLEYVEVLSQEPNYQVILEKV